jgi:hypothetical protein
MILASMIRRTEVHDPLRRATTARNRGVSGELGGPKGLNIAEGPALQCFCITSTPQVGLEQEGSAQVGPVQGGAGEGSYR